MPRYRHKDRTALVYDANKKRLRNELTLLMDEIANEAMAEMTHEFEEALNNGLLPTLATNRSEIVRYLKQSVRRLYGVGTDAAEAKAIPTVRDA